MLYLKYKIYVGFCILGTRFGEWPMIRTQDALATVAFDAISAAELAISRQPFDHGDEQVMTLYGDRYGDYNMTRAVRWNELRLAGMSDDDAYAQARKEIPD
jgi:hypothetical protein